MEGHHTVPAATQPLVCLSGLLSESYFATGSQQHKQTQTADWEMWLFPPLWFIVAFILLPETWQTISCVAAAICRYPSSVLRNSLSRAWKHVCVWQKGFSSPSTLLTIFLSPICSALPPSWPLCFLHMLVPLTSIFFLTFTYVRLLMPWSCSLSFQLPPSIRKKCNPSSSLSSYPSQLPSLYFSLGCSYTAQYHQEDQNPLN